MDGLNEFIIDDDRSFGRLVDKYKERILLVALRIVRNKEEAKDLAQEAFARAYQNRSSFRGESGFYTWVYKIVVNLALNYVKRNRDRRAESINSSSALALTVSVPDPAETAELTTAISDSIEKLPPRQRTVFILRHYEEKPYSEIAQLLSITEGAAKANYHQAVQKLKNKLAPYIKEGNLTK
jgi:RNA polymerase sigma factor (sigma-70 family)